MTRLALSRAYDPRELDTRVYGGPVGKRVTLNAEGRFDVAILA